MQPDRDAADRRTRVSRLFVYPLKSAGGIALDRAELDALGVRHDRRWMLLDGAGRFISQRRHPRMALLRPRLEGDRVAVEADGLEPLVLPRPAVAGGTPMTVDLWGRPARALDCGRPAAERISSWLGEPVRLVYMPPELARPVNAAFAVDHGDRVALADGYPLHLLTASAIDLLNGRLATPLDVRRFRPNIVVEGAPPHAEDGWRLIRVDGVILHVVKPCARCTVTTTDQDTAAQGREPLRTLATYRRWDGAVHFGQNLIHEGPGELRVGSAVEVLQRRDPVPPIPVPADT